MDSSQSIQKPVNINRNSILYAYKKKKRDQKTQMRSSRRKGKVKLKPIPSRYERPKIPTPEDWWTKPPTLAGEGCTPVQQRLAKLESFTGSYKKRTEEGVDKFLSDYHSDPKKVSRLLLNKSYQELTIPQRSNDFVSEVGWRKNLRPNLDY